MRDFLFSLGEMEHRNFHMFLIILLLLGITESRRRNPGSECIDGRHAFHEITADVVLTGTVKRLYGVREGQLYAGEVQVKRVMKGMNINVGESLLVEGFGNSDVCESNVKVRDSKVFLLNQLPTGRFKLNSSLLHINVPNLERVAAAVKGELYIRRPAIEDEPCEKKFCPYNGDCYMDNQRPQCRCPSSCPHLSGPVCASDGTSYTTECQMRSDTCRRQKPRIYVKHLGTCI